MTEQAKFYDLFTEYGLEPARLPGEIERAIVPESELQALIEYANLAKAAAPAQCQHPADSLEPFDLIDDTCVCPACGAVLKNYGNREAAALGIEPGWHKLNAALLSAEIHHALKPALDLLNHIAVQTTSHNHGTAAEIITWSDTVAYQETARKLERVR